ncbi:hypothetical protein KCP69_08980 [Salmonella enterica subsp. enterica]|nr:hypothetical protein KCP69_08980 [Salmonella enterica subsp. enterica]
MNRRKRWDSRNNRGGNDERRIFAGIWLHCSVSPELFIARRISANTAMNPSAPRFSLGIIGLFGAGGNALRGRLQNAGWTTVYGALCVDIGCV